MALSLDCRDGVLLEIGHQYTKRRPGIVNMGLAASIVLGAVRRQRKEAEIDSVIKLTISTWQGKLGRWYAIQVLCA